METETSTYRGHRFSVRADAVGDLWLGRFQLLEGPSMVPESASHRSIPLDPAWATSNEAKTNATERAHAAIDALVDTEQAPSSRA